MNEFILRLSDFEYIKFVPSDTLNFSDMFFCTEMKVYFMDNSGSLCIGSDSAGQIFEQFLNLLQKSIHGALILHESLDQNLGFIYNEYFDNTPQSMMVFQAGNSEMHWVVYDYILWRAF